MDSHRPDIVGIHAKRRAVSISVFLSVCLYVCLSVCLSVSVSLSLCFSSCHTVKKSARLYRTFLNNYSEINQSTQFFFFFLGGGGGLPVSTDLFRAPTQGGNTEQIIYVATESQKWVNRFISLYLSIYLSSFIARCRLTIYLFLSIYLYLFCSFYLSIFLYSFS